MLQLPAFLKQKKALYTVLGVSMLVLVLIMLFMGASKQSPQGNGPTVTPGITDENGAGGDTVYPTIQLEPQTVLSGVSDGEAWQTTVIADQNDPEWQTNAPQDITLSYEPVERNVLANWRDPAEGAPAYMWLVGYWIEPFDPIEKFREENLETIRWNGVYAQSRQGLEQNAQYTSAMFDFPRSAKTLYFYMYKRTELPDGTFRDYIYGADGTPNTPFVQKLTKS